MRPFASAWIDMNAASNPSNPIAADSASQPVPGRRLSVAPMMDWT
jgi:hypothetical protein